MTARGRLQDRASAWERQRLVNRAAALAMLATLLAIMGAVGVAAAFEHSRSAAVRAASTSPLVAAAGAALWARSARAQLRRAESEGSSEIVPAPVPLGLATGAVEEERRASADLRAIDEVVRAFHRARAAPDAHEAGHPWTSLLAGEARLDLPDGGGRQYAERSRTVHVLGDFAVVISAYDVERREGHARGVTFLQLRLAAEGWRVHDAVSRSVEHSVTERVVDPRPLGSRAASPAVPAQLRA